jgi:hypothetical protein
VRLTRRSGAAAPEPPGFRTIRPPSSVSDISPPLVVDGIIGTPFVLNTMFANILNV